MLQMHIIYSVFCLALSCPASVSSRSMLKLDASHAPALLHHAVDVQHFCDRSFSAHKVSNVQRFIVALQDLEGDIVRATEGKCADRRNSQEWVGR